MELPTASIREFARIVGVDHSAVVRAVKAGGRLPGSVAYEDGKPRIIISIGCYEWLSNKKHEKDHGTVRRGIMPPDVSSQMDRHYSALLRRIEYEKASGELMPAARQQQEAAEFFRACRDSIWTLPLTVSDIAKSSMVRFVRGQGDEDLLTMKQLVK